MKNFFYLVIFFFAIETLQPRILIAQNFNNSQLVAKIWEQQTGNPDTINWSASVFDKGKNLIVVGNTLKTLTNADMLITKYNEQGNLVWQVQYYYGFDSMDYATAVAVDSDMNIYVAGASYT